MYRPPMFEITDQAALVSFAGRHPFATVISAGEGGVLASHLPLLCDAEPLQIRGHLAKANPQVAHLRSGCDLTMIFHGPHSYVSPGHTAGAPLLPTWNYAAVHARGRARILPDDAAKRLLGDMVERLERGRPNPWRLESAGGLVGQLFPEILAFDVQDVSFESRLKRTRDRSFEDRQSAIEALGTSDDPIDREILMLLRGQG